MKETIIQFIQEQTCATICCVDEQGKPWCFSCYYAFNRADGLLYYKSSPDSHHAPILKGNPFIAGTILPDKLNKLLVKGIQFEGIILGEQHPSAATASGFYYKRFPIALAMTGDLSVIQINRVKMTDSTAGFGKKITWNRGE